MCKDLLEVLQLNLISNQMYLGFSITQFLILGMEAMARKKMEAVLKLYMLHKLSMDFFLNRSSF